MDSRYWIGRKHSAMGMARDAATAEARLIHYDLAGRYSIMAAQCLPFSAAAGQRGTRGERAVLHQPLPEARLPAPVYLPTEDEGS
ncbi:MAG: hypothetical protein QOH04_3241 [Sphingomonadales bacterium]|jgi:hypothetical protein|nr:hypothetical protein [Sphingomonadales bacterium]MEA3037439.1 hypothetical protein [Sphingomonadales bacterium]